jgi:hypothetical protein
MRFTGDVHEPPPAKDPRVGDTVLAEDGVLGRVDRIIRYETEDPVYLVVSSRSRMRRRYPVIPSAFVAGIDRSQRRVYMRGLRARLERLSESLPLVA